MGVASDIEMGKDIHPLANLPPYCFCVSEYGYLRWYCGKQELQHVERRHVEDGGCGGRGLA